MKLYYAPGACSLAVHIALRELGLASDLVSVDLATHRTAAGDDYFAVNPRGYVPLLELEDGSRHTEVAALLQHLGERAPESGLLPAQGAQRLEVLKWLTFVSSELHKAMSPWLWHKETADSTRRTIKDKLALRFAELDRHLAGRGFLAGDAFTVADAYAFAIVRWAPLLGIPLAPYPQLAMYLERVAARPAVHAALLAEGLVKA
ncbi:glutathione transferase GstA [Ramlibacter sp.]|uniref:glutathione transferase GstA n=1 Tax=Ramlibacter sp. TaxID=1917967 RepID=UPI0017FB9D05|nr:glutathione transferase GstA [Ramlibacter sp.]MBA2672975.1 glutathione transferase GstA [Ramlibacter sp.]